MSMALLLEEATIPAKSNKQSIFRHFYTANLKRRQAANTCLRFSCGYLLKVDIIPHDKRIDCPNFSAEVCLSAAVLIEQSHKLIRVKIPLCTFAFKCSFNNIIILFLFEPLSDRYGKSQLFLLCCEMRNVIFSPINTKFLTVVKTSETAKPVAFKPYLVKVNTDALNIRKGAGTNFAKTGCITDKGTYTIVAESKGQGSDKGWGKLKSGADWISLDYCIKK